MCISARCAAGLQYKLALTLGCCTIYVHMLQHVGSCRGLSARRSPAICFYDQVVSDLHIYPPSRGESFSYQLKCHD